MTQVRAGAFRSSWHAGRGALKQGGHGRVVVNDGGQEVNVSARCGHRDRRIRQQREWLKSTGYDLDENLFVWGNTGKMGDGITWRGKWARRGRVDALEMLRVGPVGPEFAMGGNDIEVVALQLICGHSPRGGDSATKRRPVRPPTPATRTRGLGATDSPTASSTNPSSARD